MSVTVPIENVYQLKNAGIVEVSRHYLLRNQHQLTLAMQYKYDSVHHSLGMLGLKYDFGYSQNRTSSEKKLSEPVWRADPDDFGILAIIALAIGGTTAGVAAAGSAVDLGVGVGILAAGGAIKHDVQRSSS